MTLLLHIRKVTGSCLRPEIAYADFNSSLFYSVLKAVSGIVCLITYDSLSHYLLFILTQEVTIRAITPSLSKSRIMRVFGFRDEPCLMLKVITFTLKMTKEPRAETSDNLNIR